MGPLGTVEDKTVSAEWRPLESLLVTVEEEGRVRRGTHLCVELYEAQRFPQTLPLRRS